MSLCCEECFCCMFCGSECYSIATDAAVGAVAKRYYCCCYDF